MSTFILHPNGTIYLYHWITRTHPFKASTRLKIEASRWNKEKMRPKSSSYTYKGINVTKELVRIESAFLEAWNYYQTNPGFSPIKLKQKFKSNLSTETNKPVSYDNKRFLGFFSEMLEEYKVTMKRNSWKGYYTTLNHLKAYFGKNKPNFEDIDMEFYSNYKKFLIQQGLAMNTVSTHWKFIKAIMKQAQHRRLHSNTDYLMFKRSNEAADTIYLTENELQILFDVKLKGYLDKARNFFLVGCYTGLRYEDWDQVSKSKIKDGQITLRSSKTGVKSIIPVSNNLLRILHKYPKGDLPPKPTNQKMNLFIKEVVKKAEIDELIETRITKGGKKIVESQPKYKLVSTHTARRSFATIMILNGIQPYLIMKITGHKSLSSFEKYIRFDELQASIQLQESDSFKNSFGKALTWSEKMQSDPEFKEERKKLLLGG